MPLYGAMLWDFSSEEVNYFYTQWRKSIRKIWNLPYNTHCNLLSLIIEDIPIEVQLHKRFIKFMQSLINSTNVCAKQCVFLALNDSGSSSCNSINHIAWRYGTPKNKLFNYNKVEDVLNLICVSKNNNLTRDVYQQVGNIIDLCNLRDSNSSAFHRAELNEMITYLCTN